MLHCSHALCCAQDPEIIRHRQFEQIDTTFYGLVSSRGLAGFERHIFGSLTALSVANPPCCSKID